MAGRKPKPCVIAGRTVDGLAKDTDGRYRIIATGRRFSAQTESVALEMFRRLTGDASATATIEVPSTERIISPIAPSLSIINGGTIGTINREVAEHFAARGNLIHHPVNGEPVPLIAGYPIPEAALAAWFRDQFNSRPDWVADVLGVPNLVRVAADRPQAAITFDAIEATYKRFAETTKDTRSKIEADWSEFTRAIGGTTLDDITTAKAIEYREMVKADPKITSAEYISNKFGRVRTILNFAIKNGLPPEPINRALLTLRVLVGPKILGSGGDPDPIEREAYRTLLDNASGEMRIVLLLAMNLCLHLEEVLTLEWDWFDIAAKTFVSDRIKTGIVRCAYLWDETIEELKKFQRKGGCPFVLVSPHGSRFSRQSYYKKFARLRDNSKVKSVTFDTIRDGAFTHGFRGSEERFARILAGHRSQGELDKYVKRHPEMVKPATDAVYKHYLA